jgi:hypothetical protein
MINITDQIATLAEEIMQTEGLSEFRAYQKASERVMKHLTYAIEWDNNQKGVAVHDTHCQNRREPISSTKRT